MFDAEIRANGRTVKRMVTDRIEDVEREQRRALERADYVQTRIRRPEAMP
jgi:hypothetical protein